jgi:type I restriction enzyme S subunit
MAEERKVPAIRFAGFTDDWKQRKFGEFATRESNTCESSVNLPSVEYEDICAEEGRLNKDIKLKYTQKTGILFNGSQVLYGKLRPYLHNWLEPDFSGVAVGDWWVLKPENLGKGFLYRIIQTKKFDVVANQSTGSKMPRADWKLVSETEFFIPKTVDEQHLIDKYLESLDNLITLHQRKYDKLVQFKKAMLQKMFPQNGAKVPEIRFAGFTGDWEQRKVGDLTNILSASRVHKEEWADEGVPFFRSSDVVSAFKGTENEKAFISFELYEQLAKSSGKLEKYDILITGGGSIGIPYIVPNNKPLYSKDADLIWIKRSENFDSEFLYTYFISGEFRRYLSSISHTGTIAHYTIEQVKETPVRLPSIDEQKAIGNYFSDLDRLITLHQYK